MAGRGYLDAYLQPLAKWLEDPAVSEISINPDTSIWIEREGQEHLEKIEAPAAIEAHRLAGQIAGAAGLAMSAGKPIFSARTDWKGHQIRVQGVSAPAIEDGTALSLRKYSARRRRIADFAWIGPEESVPAEGLEAILRDAVLLGRNVLISGGTSSAKTSLARALIDCVPDGERLITIEDARELHPKQPNRVELVAERDDDSPRSAAKLLQSALRMRPDRIIVGELRGIEAWTFLEAINTGHGGSITTVHAETPELATERIAMMVTGLGIAMPYDAILNYISQSIDLIVQLQRRGGQRGVVSVHRPKTRSDQDGA